MFACHPRYSHVSVTTLACSKNDWACLLVFLISRCSRPPWRGEERPERHLACKKAICVSMSVGTEEWCACGLCLGLCVCVSVGGRAWLCSYSSVFVCKCNGPHVWACALFPQAVTGVAAESLLTYPARVSVCMCFSLSLGLSVCLSFCLISTSCFILGLIQTQHSCAVSQRKRAWRMGCQVLVSAAMLYNCYQQMEGKWGYQLGLIFSL